MKYADFQTITRSRTTGLPFETAAEVETIAQALLTPLFPTPKGIRLLGVTVSSFGEETAYDAAQLQLVL